MNHKVLILLLYYERPNLVRNALNSILKANEKYQNWYLVVHDDGSDNHATPIVREVLKPVLDRVGIVRTEMTVQDKVDSGGLLGKQLNDIIRAALYEVRPDLFCMLCDDDELHPEYLANLNTFFDKNSKIMSCYSKVVCCNPLTGEVYDSSHPMATKLNRWDVPICGSCRVDASQVAWRASCHEAGAWFHYPCVKDHDAHFFQALYDRCGPMHPTGFVAQYKGVHEKQLGNLGAWRAWVEKDIDKGASDGRSHSGRQSDCKTDQG